MKKIENMSVRPEGGGLILLIQVEGNKFASLKITKDETTVPQFINILEKFKGDVLDANR